MNRSHQIFVLILFLFFLLSSSCAAQWVPGKGDDNSPPGYRTWIIQNNCKETVLLALHYQNLDGRVITQGWHIIAPGKQLRFAMISEWIAYYGRTASDGYYWAGTSDNRPKCGADFSKNFTYPNDGSRQGVRMYNYKWISIIQEPQTTLTCP